MENVEIHTHITNVMRITILCAFHYCEINIYIYTFDLFISIKILLALFSNSFCTRAIYFAIIIKMLLNIQKEKKKINK